MSHKELLNNDAKYLEELENIMSASISDTDSCTTKRMHFNCLLSCMQKTEKEMHTVIEQLHSNNKQLLQNVLKEKNTNWKEHKWQAVFTLQRKLVHEIYQYMFQFENMIYDPNNYHLTDDEDICTFTKNAITYQVFTFRSIQRLKEAHSDLYCYLILNDKLSEEKNS